MRRLRVGDYVREVDGTKIGVVIRVIKDVGLVIVTFPPSREGFAYHPDCLVKL